MTPQQINVKLQSMKGNSYKYGKDILTVSSFKINSEDEAFTMTAGKTRFNRTFKQAPEFFKHWYETKENLANDAIKSHLQNTDTGSMEVATVTNSGELVTTKEEQNTNLATDLIKILKENIEKVQKNPSYIKQAMVIDKSVGTILNVKRLEMAMVKEMNKINGNDESGEVSTRVRRKKA